MMDFDQFVAVLGKRILFQSRGEIEQMLILELLGGAGGPQTFHRGCREAGFFSEFTMGGDQRIALLIAVAAREHPDVLTVERTEFAENQKFPILIECENMHGIGKRRACPCCDSAVGQRCRFFGDGPALAFEQFFHAAIVAVMRVYWLLMRSLTLRMHQADALLAPYAVKNGGGLGRRFPESDDATRFPFQRDRDRIIHTQSFRRLKHKTQVFVTGLRPPQADSVRQGSHGDHYRTRITHTIEVAQISRDIARTLGLNEDLAEGIALAHDLGHTPFGHAGEAAMDACLKPFGKRFEHNEQSLRIVTLLEQRTSSHPGLNLSIEILEGLSKHRPSPLRGLRPESRAPSLEAQIVNLADEIAYTAHDTDDGLRAGQCTLFDIAATTLGSLAYRRTRDSGTELRGALVDLLVTDLYAATESLLRCRCIQRLEDVYAAESALVGFSEAVKVSLAELRTVLLDSLYQSEAVLLQAGKGQQIIRALFRAYLKSPPEKVKELQKKTGGDLEDAVKDYIAGMTDPYAMEAYERLEVRG